MSVYICSPCLPLWLQVVCSSTIPSTSHGPSPPSSSIWDPRISSLTSRGGGLSDLCSAPAAGPNGRTHRSLPLVRACWGNREKTGVKGSFDQASRDARSSSSTYFFFPLLFFLLGLGRSLQRRPNFYTKQYWDCTGKVRRREAGLVSPEAIHPNSSLSSS